MTTMVRRVGVGLCVIALATTGALTACGDDDDAGGGGGGGGSDVEAYCALSGELGQGEGGASDDQLNELLELAPDEIRDDVETVVEAIQAEDAEAVGSSEVVEAGGRISDFEGENCGSDST